MYIKDRYKITPYSSKTYSDELGEIHTELFCQKCIYINLGADRSIICVIPIAHLLSIIYNNDFK